MYTQGYSCVFRDLTANTLGITSDYVTLQCVNYFLLSMVIVNNSYMHAPQSL